MVIDNVELNMYDISQRDEILLLMLRKGTITRKDAASIYCFELSSRILELENHNWTINKEKLYVKRKN